MENIDTSQLSIGDLRTYAAIAKGKNVSAAARELEISQPTASYALDKLRSAFGDPLLVRSGRGMELTAFGERLYGQCRLILSDIEKLQESRGFDPERSTREFHVICTTSDLKGPYSGLTGRFRKEAPNASMTFHAFDMRDIDRQLHDTVDLMIGPEQPPRAGIISQHLKSYPIVIYYDPKVSAPPKTIEEMLERDFLRLHQGDNRPGIVDHAIEKAGHPPRKFKFSVTDFTGFADALVGTDLLMTGSTIMQETDVTSLAIAPLPLPCPQISHAARWSRRKDTDPALHWLINLFVEASDAYTPRPAPVYRHRRKD